MAQTPPNLTTLPGGTAHLEPPTLHGAVPDACKVLTPAMVLILIPGAGPDGVVTTPRSSNGGGQTPVLCQYLATPKGSDAQAGNIMLDFGQAAHDTNENNTRFFQESSANAKGLAGFVDYRATLGTHSLAYYDPNTGHLEILYKGRPFDVVATGEFLNRDAGKWRDNVDVPVARDVIARMNTPRR